jgi:hypothetical protein
LLRLLPLLACACNTALPIGAEDLASREIT